MKRFLLPPLVVILSFLEMNCLKADPINFDSSKAQGATLDIGISYFLASSIPFDSWTCSLSVNCQNVYDLDFTQTDTLSISITAVTGDSVVRLSVFGPSSGLNGINLINSSYNDHVCPNPPTLANQNQGVSTSVAIASIGTYRIAIGRDWGSSAGDSGNFDLTLSTASGTLGSLTKTVTNAATQSSGMQCP